MEEETPHIETIGTFLDLKIGYIYFNKTLTRYKEEMHVTFQVIRELTEQDWRRIHNYYGPLPEEGNDKARFFEILALD
jgi:hypothetical protein